MSIPEFGDHLDPEPKDIDRIMDLLPERCKGCKHAEFMIMLLLSFESSTGGPWPYIEDTEEYCTGWEGEVEPTNVEALDTKGGVRLGLFMPMDDFFGSKGKCPYARLHDH
ncbi:MAG: hypothetical protein WD887_02875 [Candidatus Saccharimonadales bacterium]